ncbi:retrotransposon protein, putative, ty1-copia subclass [Tanacetum coccineum]|uniref:Retrotransposon protein, putative, ty1-copia subclass n=1 Tax=Tanacetum coccineum TaxID=301880 RepID=A0ABQ5G2W2_9ASTR
MAMISAFTTIEKTAHNSRKFAFTLSPTNYDYWKTMIEPFLITNNLMGYVDGLIPCPSKTLSVTDGATVPKENPNYSIWVSNDAHVRMLIISTISEASFRHVQGTTSRDLWLSLEKAYAPHSTSREYTLKTQLLRIEMHDDETPDAYLNCAQEYADALAAIGEPVKDKDLVMLAVSGIREEYNGLKTTITARQSPTAFNELHALLGRQAQLSELTAQLSALGFQVSPIAPSGPQAFYGVRPSNNNRNNNNNNRGNRNNSRGNNNNRGRGNGRQFDWASTQNTVYDTCNRCGIGHIPSQCPNRDPSTIRTRPSANFANTRTQSSNASANWHSDTGANSHVTPDLEAMDNSEAYYGDDALHVGNGKGLPILHIGSSKVYSPQKTFSLKNILHVPEISHNLLSVQKFCHDNDVFFEFHTSYFVVKDESTHTTLLTGPSKHGLYTITLPQLKSINKVSFLAVRASPTIWHRRLGHPNQRLLRSMLSNFSLPVTNKSLSSFYLLCLRRHQLLDGSEARKADTPAMVASLMVYLAKMWMITTYTYSPAPASDSAANVLAKWNAIYDAYNEVACLMLGSMTPKLHRQFKNYSPYEMLKELKSMFEKQVRVPNPNFPRLQTRGGDFAVFVRNYNMHNMGKTIGELHAMLIEYKKGLPKKTETPQVMAIKSGKIQKTNKKSLKDKGKGKANVKGKDKQVYIPKPKNPKPTAKEYPAKDDTCHHCKEVGHWKRNCPVYLAELLKKKKQVHCQFFRGARKLEQGALYLYVGNGVRAQVEAIESFDLVLPNDLLICLDNCHYALTISRGVVSDHRLVESEFVQCFTYYGISVSKNDVLYFNVIPCDGIYEIDMHNLVLNVNSIYNVSNKRAKHNLDSAYLWHYRLAHISKKRIEKLQHEGLLKSTDDESFDQCVSCLSGKMTRKPFPHRTERATNLLGIIHSDVCGPLRHVSRQGASYFITFTDDYSRYGYVYLLKHKHEVFETFKVFKNEVENQLGKTIKALRSDRGYPKETMGYYFYFPPENKIVVARYAEFFEKSLITQEVSGRAIDLEEIQDGDTLPSEITSEIPMEVEEEEEHSLGDLNEPTSYKAAMLDPESNKWLDVMNAEMQSMIDNKVWVLIDLPPNCKTVGSKWIFKKKTDMDGIVHTYKTRLVSKGYSQLYGVDYEETFSPVDDIRAIRILISIATFYDYEICWNKKFDEEIKKFGFAQNLDESCVYQKASGSNVTFLILYVDDIIIMGNHIPSLQSVKDYLGKCFAMKDLRETAFILEIKIYRDRSKRLIRLSQSAYMDKILKRYKMDNSKRGHIPMQERLDLNKTQGASTPKEVKRVVDSKSSKQSTTTMYTTKAEYIGASKAAMEAV